jgi:hypothetical protein
MARKIRTRRNKKKSSKKTHGPRFFLKNDGAILHHPSKLSTMYKFPAKIGGMRPYRESPVGLARMYK